MEKSYDVLVVGARCAGASTALLLARAGARVLLVDRGRRGDDTISTHALMRGGVVHLARWGLLDRVIASGAPPIRTSRFVYDGEIVDIPVKPGEGSDALYAPRRTVLDRILVDAAEEAGADVAFGTSLVELTTAGARVTGAVLRTGEATCRVSAAMVVGADGIASTVARGVGAETIHAARSAAAVLYGYFGGLSSDGYCWAFAPGSASGLIPTHGGHCVFVYVSAAARHRLLAGGRGEAFRSLLAKSLPGVAATLGDRQPRLHAFGGVPGFLRRPWGPGWALVGDAGYFRDPATAHGITDAFRDAELLARAILRGGEAALEDYGSLRLALSLPLMRITDRIAACDWTMPELQRLHAELNHAMKTQASVLAGFDPVGRERTDARPSALAS